MKILMFGWEFPPHNQGGLGTACYGLTKALNREGNSVSFILPYYSSRSPNFLKIIPTEGRKRIKASRFHGYMTYDEYMLLKSEGKASLYGKDLFEEVNRFAVKGSRLALDEDFDIIHAHDWLTFKAGIMTKEITGKPLVVHIHATEYDRTGGNGINPHVYSVELEGMQKADKIVAVSNYTKNQIICHYGIDPRKIDVVYNAVDIDDIPISGNNIYGNHRPFDEKTILFLGRITLQKGPDYYLYAAKKVLDHDKNFRFIISGSGDMEPLIIEKAAELGISDKVTFTGFLKGRDIDRAYRMADLYVMPSVSEPFGITPLEAMKNGTPALISLQSGVSEVVSNALKCDFWDIDEMADKIISILRYPEGYDELKENSSKEIGNFSWINSARQLSDIYKGVLGW